MVKLDNNLSPVLNRNLSTSTSKLRSTLLALSSGKRINKASDDAAALAIAESLKSDIKTSSAAARNISDGVSFLSIGEGALGSASNILSRLGELSAQAANGALSDSQRSNLDNEYQALVSELNRLEGVTTFNGQSVLGSSVDLQTGIDGSDTSQTNVSVASVNSSTLGLAGTSIASQADAQAALDATRTATADVASARAEIGASESRLQVAYNNLKTSELNNEAARSRLEDADVASLAAQKTSAEILQRGGASLLGLSNRTQAGLVQKLLQS